MVNRSRRNIVKKILTLLTITLTALTLTACSQNEPAQQAAQPAQPSSAAPAAPSPMENKAGGTSGTVVETVNAAGYTYVQVDNGSEKIWAAAPAFAVSVGDSVVVPDGMPMQNYHSQTLNRDFPVVYFVDSVLNASAPASPATMNAAAMPAGHPQTNVATTPADVDLSNLQKPEGGMTVGEIFTDKTNLSGKDVILRAKVVKYSPQIMGKNWLHVQDGSGDSGAGTHDLTITTDVTAKVGDTVLVKGALTLDKDFGYGYRYDLILEDASITVE